MPVLALAIIVEARATINKWNKNIPAWYRFVQGILWGAPLAIYAWLEEVAFSVLAGTANPASHVNAVKISIAQGISALVIVPTVGLLVSSNAKVIALVLIRVRFVKYRIARARNIMLCKRLIRENRRRRDSYLGVLLQVTGLSLQASLNRREVEKMGFQILSLNQGGGDVNVEEVFRLALEHGDKLKKNMEEEDKSRLGLTSLLNKFKESKKDLKNAEIDLMNELSEILTSYLGA